MKTSTFLYVAAVLALIQYAAHAVLFLRAGPTHGPEEAALISAMQSHRWLFAGFNRSYWDFYYGYGLLAILWGVIEVLFLWRLGVLARTSAATAKPFVALLMLANIGHAALILRYFFLLPALFDSLVAVALLLALFAS